ncbi:MAG: ABC transporter ATP-binding protein [Candidatus Latescibacteria bacterium]|nr:ABC transporter ATP-binding protein [Candidatus Latescibacterota bacterium]
MVLKTENLGLRIPKDGNTIFEKLSFELNEGETGFVSGPAGSGKSTLGLALCGFLPLWAGSWDITGTIFLNGKLLEQGSNPAGTGMILENPYTQISGLKRTIFHELAFPLECSGVSPEEMPSIILKYAELLEISHLLDRSIRTLSGGELQRVHIAGTLMTQPRFLFFDRPLTEIDFEFRPVLMDIVCSSIKQTGAAALIAEDPWLLQKDSFDKEIVLGKKGDVEQTEWHQPVHTVNVASHIPQKAVLSVESLAFYYEADKPVLDNCSFSLGNGDITLVTGPNGSGKTTLARLIAGIIKPARGAIILDGSPIDTMEEWEIMTAVGLALQDPGLHLCRKTVGAELELARKWGNAPGKYVELLGLDRLLDIHPLELSQAEKKRLGMALACGIQRKLLILDEPTQYQDAEGFGRMVNAIITLAGEGRALLIISHDPRLFKVFPDAGIIHLSRADIS